MTDETMAKGYRPPGVMYVAKIVGSKREMLDKKALIEAFGEKAIAPYIKTTVYQTVKIVEK